MSPAEQLVMAIDSPILDGLNGPERIDIAGTNRGDSRYTALPSGERRVMTAAHALWVLADSVGYVDDDWRERIGDATARTAAAIWTGVTS